MYVCRSTTASFVHLCFQAAAPSRQAEAAGGDLLPPDFRELQVAVVSDISTVPEYDVGHLSGQCYKS